MFVHKLKALSTVEFESENAIINSTIRHTLRNLFLLIDKTFFQISFSTDSGNKSFEWLCEENKNIIRGQDLDWDGMDGTAPKQLGNIIGKYLIGKPMPIVPGM